MAKGKGRSSSSDDLAEDPGGLHLSVLTSRGLASVSTVPQSPQRSLLSLCEYNTVAGVSDFPSPHDMRKTEGLASSLQWKRGSHLCRNTDKHLASLDLLQGYIPVRAPIRVSQEWISDLNWLDFLFKPKGEAILAKIRWLKWEPNESLKGNVGQCSQV